MIPNLSVFEDETWVDAPWLVGKYLVRGYYEPAERGSYEDGVQVEPDIPASFEVVSVWLGDKDVIKYLSDEGIETIAEVACNNLKGDNNDDY